MCSSLLNQTNIKLVLAYDGTGFLGWQKTYLGPSIEECLQKVLEQIFQHDITLQAASRTDAGVHAHGQVVNFFTKKIGINEKQLLLSINALLPKTIRVLTLTIVDHSFHPTLDCNGKTYHYEVCQGQTQLPHHRMYSWHVPYELDIDEMKKAACMLIGNYDFSAFCNVKNNEVYKDKIRDLQKIDFIEIEKNRLKIALQGKNFLYKMARNLVGTLVYVGLGKIPVSNIPSIIENKDRRVAGVCAPAHGLSLFAVHYPTICG